MIILGRTSNVWRKILSCLPFLLIVCRAPPAGPLAQGAPPAPATSGSPMTPDDEPAVTAVTGPRDLLHRHGVDESQFNKLIDGQPVGDDERETLLRILFWANQFRTADVERWARDQLNLAELVKQPETGRVEFFRLVGRVARVEACRPWPEVVRRFDLKQYYRCEFILANRQQPAVIFTANVPRQWQKGGAIDQPSSALGLWLKFASRDTDRPTPVFVAPRVAWHPETLLGNLGMDVGLLDNVKNKRRLTGRESECFYQMLAAVGRGKSRQLLRKADQELKRSGRQTFSVVPLFNEDDQQHGRLVALSGRARRVVRIRVEDPDVVTRFGIDHFYNLFVFTKDSQDNPVVFCVRRLPEGMPTGDGPEYSEAVRVAGFFMKTWAYPVAFPRNGPEPQGGRDARQQVAPLLIGKEPIWYPREPPAASTTAGAIAGGLFLLALLGIWLALWRFGRGDRQFQKQTLAKALSVDSTTSLDEIGLSADRAPDFSGLDGQDPPGQQK